MVSGRSTVPASVPSRVMILSCISGALLLDRRSAFGGRGLGFARARFTLRHAELARLGNAIRKPFLHRVAKRDPAALVSRHGALNQDQATLGIGLHDLEIERGDTLDTQVAGHLFVLEGLAGILAPTGRSMRAMRYGDAVGSAQAGEVPAFHRTRKALAGRNSRHIDELTNHEMIGRDLGTDWNEIALLHAELDQLALGLDLRHGEMPAFRLGQIIGLARSRAELQRNIAILVLAA